MTNVISKYKKMKSQSIVGIPGSVEWIKSTDGSTRQ